MAPSSPGSPGNAPTAAPGTDHRTTNTRYVVEVNEVAVFATGRGADWWATFLFTHYRTGRITEVTVSLGGAVCHVACDSKDHAAWLAQWMVQQHGLPRTAVKVRALREGGAR